MDSLKSIDPRNYSVDSGLVAREILDKMRIVRRVSRQLAAAEANQAQARPRHIRTGRFRRELEPGRSADEGLHAAQLA